MLPPLCPDVAKKINKEETLMKKTYETPVAEKVEFCYEDQIVASDNYASKVNTSEEGCIIGGVIIPGFGGITIDP